MAFSYTVTGVESIGSIKIIYGTYTNGSTDSGGTITVGMGNVVSFDMLPSGSVDETVPKVSAVSAGVVTVVTPTGSVGTWSSMGK